MQTNVFIFHGTEGHPKENWFPWLKSELENKGINVIVPHFPSPPIIAAKIDEWFEVFKPFEKFLDKNAIIVGHSLGGIFTLRVLEKLEQPIKAALFTGTPIGIQPIKFYERDFSFSGFDFDWDKIRKSAEHFAVFHSNDDPYVDLANGKRLSEDLGVELNFVPNAGHFNTKSGYTSFVLLKEKLDQFLA